MDWVVGQWVAINGKPAKICGIRETMIDYTYEPGSGRIYHLGVYDAAVGPFAWQSGRTYRTTLEGAYGKILSIDDKGDMYGNIHGSSLVLSNYWHAKTGKDFNGHRGADLLPFLADQASESPATETGWVVGQWVDYRGEAAKIEKVDNALTVRFANGSSVRLCLDTEFVKPFQWQVGKTYRTTLEGVTATIGGFDRDKDVVGQISGNDGLWAWNPATGRMVEYEDATFMPHLLPYLADEPSEPAATEPTLTERFTVEPDGDRWRVRDNQTGFVASGFLSAELAENALEGMKGGDMEWIWSLAEKSFATAHLRLSRYHRTIKGVTIDLYDIAAAYGVKGHAEFHAVKKILMAGNRGYKSREQDLAEAEQSIQRARELAKGGE